MPSLTFRLSNPRVEFESAVEHGQASQLSFTSRPERIRQSNTFTLRSKIRDFDGYELTSGSRFEVRSESVKKAVDPGQSTPSPEVDMAGLGVLGTFWDGATGSPSIGFTLAVDRATFSQLLKIAISRPSADVVVTVWTELLQHDEKMGIVFGNDPDGGDLEWLLPREEADFYATAAIEKFSISIGPIKDLHSENQQAASDAHLEATRHLLDRKGPIALALRRVLWAVIAVGIMVVLLKD